jgi:hypothetical protein
MLHFELLIGHVAVRVMPHVIVAGIHNNRLVTDR